MVGMAGKIGWGRDRRDSFGLYDRNEWSGGALIGAGLGVLGQMGRGAVSDVYELPDVRVPPRTLPPRPRLLRRSSES
jgi:hypothetical protein